jgi:hypothetical protein
MQLKPNHKQRLYREFLEKRAEIEAAKARGSGEEVLLTKARHNMFKDDAERDEAMTLLLNAIGEEGLTHIIDPKLAQAIHNWLAAHPQFAFEKGLKDPTKGPIAELETTRGEPIDTTQKLDMSDITGIKNAEDVTPEFMEGLDNEQYDKQIDKIVLDNQFENAKAANEQPFEVPEIPPDPQDIPLEPEPDPEHKSYKKKKEPAPEPKKKLVVKASKPSTDDKPKDAAFKETRIKPDDEVSDEDLKLITRSIYRKY